MSFRKPGRLPPGLFFSLFPQIQSPSFTLSSAAEHLRQPSLLPSPPSHLLWLFPFSPPSLHLLLFPSLQLQKRLPANPPTVPARMASRPPRIFSSFSVPQVPVPQPHPQLCSRTRLAAFPAHSHALCIPQILPF